MHRSRQRRTARSRDPDRGRCRSDRRASPTRPCRRIATCWLREPRIDLILGGHEHEALDSTVSGRHVVKADANAESAQFVTLWGGKGSWRQATGLVPINAALPPDTAVARVVAEWNDSLARRLGPERDRGSHRACAIDPATSLSRRRESMLGDLVSDAMRAGTGADVALLNSGTLRLDEVIQPGSGHQSPAGGTSSRLPTRPGSSPSRSPERATADSRAQRIERGAGYRRIPPGLRRSRSHSTRPSPRVSRVVGEHPTPGGTYAGGPKTRCWWPWASIPPVTGGDGYEVPEAQPACAKRESAPQGGGPADPSISPTH